MDAADVIVKIHFGNWIGEEAKKRLGPRCNQREAAVRLLDLTVCQSFFIGFESLPAVRLGILVLLQQ